MEKQIKTIGVLTSGGDAPGMNAAVRAVVRTGLHKGFRMIGIQRGYNGLLNGECFEMNLRSVSNIISAGGTILYTARCLEFKTKEGQDKGAAKCRELGVNVALSEVWARGGEGGLALADEVVALCENGDEAGRSADTFTFSYEDDLSIAEKIEAIAKRVYHADGVVFEPAAQKEIAQLEALGFGEMPVCMAKTQYSLSDDPALPGAPRDFTVTVRSLKVSAGAGFIVAYTGDIMTMPGLPRVPAAENIDVDENGVITGLF